MSQPHRNLVNPTRLSSASGTLIEPVANLASAAGTPPTRRAVWHLYRDRGTRAPGIAVRAERTSAQPGNSVRTLACPRTGTKSRRVLRCRFDQRCGRRCPC